MQSPWTQGRRDRVALWVFLVLFSVFTFAAGELHGASRHRGLPGPVAPVSVDGGAGFPANASPVTAEDLRPGALRSVPICDGPSCPYPGPASSSTPAGDEAHDAITFVLDHGGSVTVARSTLVVSSCNEPGNVLVEDFGQCLFVMTGERMDRLDRDVRRGRLARIESCTTETPAQHDGVQGDSGYVVAQVEQYPAGGWHWNPKTGAFTAEEN
jgi:hypothetical protein